MPHLVFLVNDYCLWGCKVCGVIPGQQERVYNLSEQLGCTVIPGQQQRVYNLQDNNNVSTTCQKQQRVYNLSEDPDRDGDLCI